MFLESSRTQLCKTIPKKKFIQNYKFGRHQVWKGHRSIINLNLVILFHPQLNDDISLCPGLGVVWGIAIFIFFILFFLTSGVCIKYKIFYCEEL